MRLRDRRVQATYPVRLTCQVVGNPPPMVTWFKDGEEVVLDSKYHFKQEVIHCGFRPGHVKIVIEIKLQMTYKHLVLRIVLTGCLIN